MSGCPQLGKQPYQKKRKPLTGTQVGRLKRIVDPSSTTDVPSQPVLQPTPSPTVILRRSPRSKLRQPTYSSQPLLRSTTSKDKSLQAPSSSQPILRPTESKHKKSVKPQSMKKKGRKRMCLP